MPQMSVDAGKYRQKTNQKDITKIGLDWIEQCFTSPPKLYVIWETVFTGQKTQLTVSKY